MWGQVIAVPTAINSPIDVGVLKVAGYEEVVAELRETVHESVPPGATVLVVSKGDPRLTDLDDRPGWHFPQTESGAYAGHHPADSAEAIAHLERLRQKGAEYLVFPSTGLWWLEHYADFRRHLESQYLVSARTDACLIYRLATQPGSKRPASYPTRTSSPWDPRIHQLRTFADCLLPPDAPVIIAGWADSKHVDLGRAMWHLPPPRSRADLDAASWPEVLLADIEDLRGAGAKFLVVLSPTYSPHSVWGALFEEALRRFRLIAHQEHFCSVFDLAGSPQTKPGLILSFGSSAPFERVLGASAEGALESRRERPSVGKC